MRPARNAPYSKQQYHTRNMQHSAASLGSSSTVADSLLKSSDDVLDHDMLSSPFTVPSQPQLQQMQQVQQQFLQQTQQKQLLQNPRGSSMNNPALSSRKASNLATPEVDNAAIRKMRKSHREKKRRNEMNDLFELLYETLLEGATVPQKKPEKLRVLSEAIQYIRTVKLERAKQGSFAHPYPDLFTHGNDLNLLGERQSKLLTSGSHNQINNVLQNHLLFQQRVAKKFAMQQQQPAPSQFSQQSTLVNPNPQQKPVFQQPQQRLMQSQPVSIPPQSTHTRSHSDHNVFGSIHSTFGGFGIFGEEVASTSPPLNGGLQLDHDIDHSSMGGQLDNMFFSGSIIFHSYFAELFYSLFCAFSISCRTA